MDYKVEDKTYSISYQELRDKYINACYLNDKDFMARLPEMAHLACVICWFKELQACWVLRDDGIIHELIHFMHFPDYTGLKVKELRKLFKEQLKLD